MNQKPPTHTPFPITKSNWFEVVGLVGEEGGGGEGDCGEMGGLEEEGYQQGGTYELKPFTRPFIWPGSTAPYLPPPSPPPPPVILSSS